MYSTMEPLPFSLVCKLCDAGQGICCEHEAIAEGWTEITLAEDLPQANYLGVCPDCYEQWNK